MCRSLILTQYSVLSTRISVLSALCALRYALSDLASAVIFLKGFLSVSICVSLRLIAFDALRSALSALLFSLCVFARVILFQIPKANLEFTGEFTYR